MTGAGFVRRGAHVKRRFRSPSAAGRRLSAGSVRHGGGWHRFRSPSAAAAAFAPARRPGRGRLAAPSALPGPAPAPSAAARFPRSRPLPRDRSPFAPAHRALSPASCRLIPESCPPSADPDGASPGCRSFFFMLFFHGWRSCRRVTDHTTPNLKRNEGFTGGEGGAIRSAGRRVTARASRQDAGESAG